MNSHRRSTRLIGLALAPVLALTGASCAVSTRSVVVKIDPATIPADQLVLCPAPVQLPDRDLTQGEIGRLWGADRLALDECARRHEALVESVDVQQ